MEFNIGKCSILRVGKNNFLYGCSLNATFLGSSRCERDFRVLVSSDLRSRNQCIQAKTAQAGYWVIFQEAFAIGASTSSSRNIWYCLEDILIMQCSFGLLTI